MSTGSEWINFAAYGPNPRALATNSGIEGFHSATSSYSLGGSASCYGGHSVSTSTVTEGLTYVSPSVTRPPIATLLPRGPGTSPGLTSAESIWFTSWGSPGSAFDQFDEDRERRAAIEAEKLRELPDGLGERVAHRLYRLIEIARCEGLETAGPLPDSIRAFRNFLGAIAASGLRAPYPNIALDGVGHVVCEWRNKGVGTSAVLRFLTDGAIGCSLTSPAPGRISPNTWYGIVDAEELRRQLMDNGFYWKLLGG